MLDTLTILLAEGTVQPVGTELLPDGLAGVRHGLERLKSGQAPRTQKLVVNLDQTPPADMTVLGTRCELDWNGH